MLSNKRRPRNGHRFKVLQYERVSQDDEKTGSFTFETQPERIRQWLDNNLGLGNYDVIVYRDNGVSGGYGPEATGVEKRTRSTLREIAEKLRTKEFDILIVYSMSRLFRSPRWFHQFHEDHISPSGTDFVSVTENLDLASAEGKAMAGVMAVFDGFYRDTVIKRCKDAIATKQEQGYYQGQVGYGWQWEPLDQVPERGRRRVQPDPDAGKWVLQMKDWCLRGWGVRRIAVELNRMGVPSPLGGKWIPCIIRRVLRNPLHAGMVPTRNGPRQGEHYERRLFDPEVREQILAVIQDRKRWRTSRAQRVLPTLMGLATCGVCGKRLYVCWDPRRSAHHKFRCVREADCGGWTCPGVGIRADALEDAVKAEVAKYSEQAEFKQILLEEAAQSADRGASAFLKRQEVLSSQVASIQARLEGWYDAFLRQTITEEQFSSYNRKLLEEKVDIESQLEQVVLSLQNRKQGEIFAERVQAAILSFPTVWENLNPDERRQLLALAVERVAVYPAENKANRVSIKLYLMSEVDVLVPHAQPNWHRAQNGVAGLSPRTLVYLYHQSQGLGSAEIAAEMKVTLQTLKVFEYQIRKRLGIRKLEDAAEMAKSRIRAEFAKLPFGGYQSPMVGKDDPVYLAHKVWEVFRLYARGATTAQVVEKLKVPRTTIQGRRRMILDAFGVKTIYDAVEKARKLGML